MINDSPSQCCHCFFLVLLLPIFSFFLSRQITFNCNWNAIFAVFLMLLLFFFVSFSHLKAVNLRIEIRNVAGYIFLVVKTFCNWWSSSDLRFFLLLIHSQFESKNTLNHQERRERYKEKLSCKSGTSNEHSTLCTHNITNWNFMNEFRYDLNKPMGNVHILFFFIYVWHFWTLNTFRQTRHRFLELNETKKKQKKKRRHFHTQNEMLKCKRHLLQMSF